jgi:hypothetical protein
MVNPDWQPGEQSFNPGLLNHTDKCMIMLKTTSSGGKSPKKPNKVVVSRLCHSITMEDLLCRQDLNIMAMSAISPALCLRSDLFRQG